VEETRAAPDAVAQQTKSQAAEKHARENGRRQHACM
jgi:hypothetical protein